MVVSSHRDTISIFYAQTCRRFRSDFTTAVPPTEFRNTTATPILPASTVAFGAAPSATNGAGSYSDGGASKLGIALGIGLGLGLPFLLGAGLAMWWYLRRKRRRASIDYSGTFEVQSVRNSKSPRALARDGDFGTDTLVDSGMEKEGTGWYGRAGHEGAYGSATIPASPVHCECDRRSRSNLEILMYGPAQTLPLPTISPYHLHQTRRCRCLNSERPILGRHRCIRPHRVHKGTGGLLQRFKGTATTSPPFLPARSAASTFRPTPS